MKASTTLIHKAGQYYRFLSLYILLVILSTGPFVLDAQPIPVCSGLKDAYLCPEEPVTPDPALLGFFTAQNASNPCFGLLEFDNFPGLTKCNGTAIPQNALFIHQVVFPVTSGSVGFASLEFRAKASPSGQTNTDFISFFEGSTYLTGANLNQLVEAAGTWNPNQDAIFTLNLGNLPSVFSVNSILSYLNDGDLDIVIGNETGVDWMCLDAVSDTCYCKDPSFTDIILHWDNGPGLSIACETSYEGIPCPQQGSGYFITGKFECVGDSCPISPFVYWELTGPSGNHFGTANLNTFFSIGLLPAYTSQPGIYTMSLTGFCGMDTCKCEFQLVVDCPDGCPCEIEDIIALQSAVNQGFATLASSSGCTVCFAPLALSDCETVNWHLNNSNGPLLGSSGGNQTFCHSFPGPGTYTVVMVVTRLKPDGTLCESFAKSKTVTITCVVNPACDGSVFRNSSFSEGAIPGGFNSGGASEGWTSILKELEVVEGAAGSLDGWTIQLHGNLDTAGILTTIDPVCLARDTGDISFRLRVQETPPCESSKYWIWKRSYKPDSSNPSDWDLDSSLQVANILLGDLDKGVWYDVTVPYDSRNWFPTDSCGEGIMIRPALLVSNVFNSVQGGEDTYTYVQVDNFCIEGMTVAVIDPTQSSGIRFFPNPTTGMLNIEIPIIPHSDMSIQVMSLTGQQILNQKVEPGIKLQTIDASTLPQGMYFLQIVSKEQVIAVNKFVKM